MHRTIYIGNPAYLRCLHSQMKIIDPDNREVKGSIPIEDIAFLLLDHPQITLTHSLMIELQSVRAAIISCDHRHLPHSVQLPLSGHSQHTERILRQVNMSEPLKKQLWKQTIHDKIHNQARVLQLYELDADPLIAWQAEVKSGDITNREGAAAKHYWSQLFDEFKRERYGDPPNHLLNYGYAILRSIVARALSSSGLHLALGIHHKSKYNATCLADDIMEPYRPFVDLLVMEYMSDNPDEDDLNRATKAHFLSLMQRDVQIDGKIRPLQIAATITSASLYKCMRGDFKLIRYPIL